jgi:ribonucleoside-diphosphate reductase alpha chain
MIDRGIPYEPCKVRPDNTVVFSFPMKAPVGSIVQDHLDPIDHLNLWLEYQQHWCDHKPSVTVSYTDDKYLAIGQWLWDNWKYASGISFLPLGDHIYEQAPFEPIDARTYNLLSGQMPSNINWNDIRNYESEDNTSDTPTLACSGGSCEVVDLVEQ